MTYYTYILYSQKFDRFYYGQTNDLNNRISKHNAGLVDSTSKFKPWVLFAYKEFKCRSEAIKTERKLKNLKSRNRVADYIAKNNFIKNI